VDNEYAIQTDSLVRLRSILRRTIREKYGMSLPEEAQEPDWLQYNKIVEELRITIERDLFGGNAANATGECAHAIELVGLWAETYRSGHIGAKRADNSDKFDSMRRTTNNNAQTQPSGTPWFILGCGFCLVAVAFASWGFWIGDLTGDQRRLLTWILPIASAITFGAFGGSISVKARRVGPAVLISATGGAAVWLLTTFVLFPQASSDSFDVTIYVRDEAGTLLELDGELTMELNALSRWPIHKGEALPRAIPLKWKRKLVKIKCAINGYTQVITSQSFKLMPDEAISIILAREKSSN
jgi:hypothetical protein